MKQLCIFILISIGAINIYGQDKSTVQKNFSTASVDPKKAEYRIGCGDVLSIEVYDNPDLSASYTVSSDGSIVFPLIGKTSVSGLNINEIQIALTQNLEKDYLYNPIVNVQVEVYRSKAVYILGNVGKPGIYYLEQPTRLFDLLSEAEGLSRDFGKMKNGQRVHIMRQGKTSPNKSTQSTNDTSFYISLHQFLIEGKRELNIYLKEGDVIYIPGAQAIHVIGEVKKPGSFPFEEGITVLKAITLAGGPTEKSSVKNAVIKRIEDGKEIEIKVLMGDLLKPEDIIEVPLSIW